MLVPVFGSEYREKALVFILARDSGYAAEIAQFFGTALNQIQKQLDGLEAGGVLVSHTVGRTRLYEFSPRYPFRKELKNLLEKALLYYPAEMKAQLRDQQTQAQAARQTPMKPIKRMTPGELGAFIQSRLRKKGIDVVLSGGMSVAIYSENLYTSRDLDLVPTFFVKRQRVRTEMEAMGFHEQGRQFAHPDTDLFIDFPPGPLTVGDEPVREVREIRYSTGVLRLISPTDCVKDRLAWYYHMNDRQCLEQAMMVCQGHEIDLGEVRRWSEHEGKLDEFGGIQSKLKRQQRS